MEENSVPEESDIAFHQEVMTGYENKPIVPTSDGAEPLPSRCAHGAENNKRLVLILNKFASANDKDRSSIIHTLPHMNDYEITSAILLSRRALPRASRI